MDDLARRYGLDPLPESVARLTELVARQDSPLEEIAELVRGDKALTVRLLRAANPHASKPEEYEITTVGQALMRNGLRGFFILAMGDPIMRAVGKTCRTMLGMEKVALTNINQVSPPAGEHLLSEVRFEGRAAGTVHLRLADRAGRLVASKLLGVDPNHADERDVFDALGEMVNIVAGNFRSNLCDANLPCTLSAPVVSRTASFSILTVPGGCSERMAFVMAGFDLFVDLSVNPWNA
jgi:chemotaxis protein CheX